MLLVEDHRRIDAMLDRLLATVRADDRDAARKQWAKVEDALLRHLDVEEMFVFPVLRTAHNAEVERLWRQHDAIRRQLGDIGVALDLHAARADVIEAFCAMLREHAESEDSLADEQAERTISVSVARSIASRIKVAAKSLRATRARASHARSTP